MSAGKVDPAVLASLAARYKSAQLMEAAALERKLRAEEEIMASADGLQDATNSARGARDNLLAYALRGDQGGSLE